MGSRDSINEMITLAECQTPKDKTGKSAHYGKFVATINSFHFTNTNQNAKTPILAPTNLICQIKLMSTAFMSTLPDAKNVNPDWRGPPMMFDKNGLQLPFDCMMSLLEAKVFQRFIDASGERYAAFKAEQAELAERRANEMEKTENRPDREDEEEEGEEENDGVGQPKKRKMAGGDGGGRKLERTESFAYLPSTQAMDDDVTLFP